MSRPFSALGILPVLLLLAGLILVGLLVLGVMGQWAFEAVWAFLSGWFTYPTRIIPKVTYNFEMILCGIGAFGLALFFGHRFLHWLAEQVPTLPSPWHFRNTAILSCLFLAMFGTSIAMTGVIHQMAWLGGAKKITRSRGMSMSGIQKSDADDLVSELYFGLDENSRFPDSLVAFLEKQSEAELTNGHLCHYERGQAEPWLYPGAGRDPKEGRFPVLISPRPNRGGEIVVAYSDLSVESYPFQALPSEIAAFFR